MYDINTKFVKKGKKMFSLFFIIGFIFLIILGSIGIGGLIKKNRMDSTVMSTRVEISSHYDDDGNTMYSPTYYYKVNGEEYACRSTSSSSIYPGDDNKLVYYDSKNPKDCISEYGTKSNVIFIAFMALPLLFIGIGVYQFIKINKRVKAIEELNQRGKLVKGLPYRMEDTGTVINNVPIQRPVVDYVLPSGVTVTLRGDSRFDKKSFDGDGLVDLVIDESNPDLYFIDFEINRLTGNTSSDYYKDANGNPYKSNVAFNQPMQGVQDVVNTVSNVVNNTQDPNNMNM